MAAKDPLSLPPCTDFPVAGWLAGAQVPLRDDQTYIPGLLNSQGTKASRGDGVAGAACGMQRVAMHTEAGRCRLR